ncbi:MAG TPA: hypothetical protein VHE55_00815 [Fimbriimonadaceae bacterium]|nr:hypothetical protein [Fimbriimonadaceae bacterium]
MRVLIFESNLMWSSRLAKSVRALGHEALIRTAMPESAEEAQAAIINLGDNGLPPKPLVEKLHALGLTVIAHAGHKEKDLHELGKEMNVEILATNSEITYKLESLLEKVTNGST